MSIRNAFMATRSSAVLFFRLNILEKVSVNEQNRTNCVMFLATNEIDLSALSITPDEFIAHLLCDMKLYSNDIEAKSEEARLFPTTAVLYVPVSGEMHNLNCAIDQFNAKSHAVEPEIRASCVIDKDNRIEMLQFEWITPPCANVTDVFPQYQKIYPFIK